MKNLLETYRSWTWESRLLTIFGLMALIPVFASLWDTVPIEKAAYASVDTHIPKGFVLIPVEVQNFEALDSILGRFGVVDLFPTSENGTNQTPVAINVRLLRAPQNPTRFAVLVPEREAPKILAHSGSYVVVVKRPDQHGTEFVKQSNKPRRKIIYGGG